MRNGFCKWWAKHNTTFIAIGVTAALWITVYLNFVDTNNPRVEVSQIRNEFGEPKSVFYPGQAIYVFRRFCVDRVVPGDVDLEVIGKSTGQFWYLGTRATGARMGCSDRTSRNILPDDIPPGEYEFRATAVYQVNPFRKVTYALPPLTFTVIPRDDK